MRRVIRFTCDEIRPDGGAILRRMHGEAPEAPYLNDLAEEARGIIHRVGRPAAVFQRIPRDQFDAIYHATAAGSAPAPLPCIARQASGIALFAGTLGSDVDAAIRAQLRRGCALGLSSLWETCMLDAFTAAACERLAQLAADQFALSLPHANVPAFPYLPGSCGWDASAGSVVLDRLHPEEIDWRPGSAGAPSLSLIAGMLIAAPAAVHRTTAQFPCCASCSLHRCLYRTSSTAA